VKLLSSPGYDFVAIVAGSLHNLAQNSDGTANGPESAPTAVKKWLEASGADRLRNRAQITDPFLISSSRHLQPLLNREIRDVE